MKKTQQKSKKQGKKKLGMGLSSLLSKDEGLASIIKEKIQTKVSGSKTFKKQGDGPNLDLVKNSVNERISKLRTKKTLDELNYQFKILFLEISTSKSLIRLS